VDKHRSAASCWQLRLLLLLQAAEDMLAGVGEMGAADLDTALAQYGVVAPDTKNPISKCFPFNLMFKTSIGPKGDLTGYLRPETAQVSKGFSLG
jgi:glycyl-tRNA synthetase